MLGFFFLNLAEFPVTWLLHGKFVCLDDVFSEFFELEENPVEGPSLLQKIRKEEKGKAKKKP